MYGVSISSLLFLGIQDVSKTLTTGFLMILPQTFCFVIKEQKKKDNKGIVSYQQNDESRSKSFKTTYKANKRAKIKMSKIKIRPKIKVECDERTR